MTVMPPSPFITDMESRFVFDEAAFMEALAPDDLPAFIASPSTAFLAGEIEPLLRTLFQRNQ
jgi:hypothetical protein